MKNYDLIIIGSSPHSQALAAELARKNRKIALIALPGQPEFLLSRVLGALDRQNVTLPDGPALTNMDLYSDQCRFLDEDTVQVGQDRLAAQNFVIASGSRLDSPSIAGLDHIAFETPLSLLTRATAPPSATIVGGGPLGVALAAHLADQKCAVTLVTRAKTLLPREDHGLRRYIHQHLNESGVRIFTEATVAQVKKGSAKDITVVIDQDEKRQEQDSDVLVLATGLVGNTEGLGLDKAGIYVDDANEVVTNEEARCSRKGAWAMGSVAGADRAFAMEAFQSEQIAHNIDAPFYDRKKLEPGDPVLFFVPGRLAYARVGLTEDEAVEKFNRVSVTESGGYLKLIAKKNGDILGAHAVGANAAAIGLFFEWAIRAQITMSDLAERRTFPPVAPSQDIHACVQSWVKANLR